MLIQYFVPVLRGTLVFTRSFEYFRKYSNRKDEIALVERLYGVRPVRYRILSPERSGYYDVRIPGLDKEFAALALAKYVGAEKVESGKCTVGEA